MRRSIALWFIGLELRYLDSKPQESALSLSTAVTANGTLHPASTFLIWHLPPSPQLPVEVKEQERVMFAAMAL